MISFDESICRNLNEALSREWLETNVLGGFASASIAGANTRRYHGLLTACAKPPVGRQLLLSKIEEVVIIDGQEFDLSTNQYDGAVHPTGFRYIREFRLDPWPVWTFEAGTAVIEKSIFLVHDRDLVCVSYRLIQGSGPILLKLRPLIAFRDYHATTHANHSIDPSVEEIDDALRIRPYQGMPSLYFAHNGTASAQVGDWYYNFIYERERERGLDFTEDLFCPLEIRGEITSGNSLVVMASTAMCTVAEFDGLRERELEHRKSVRAAAPVDSELVRDLTVAADQFIARRGTGYTIMAGYPWFTDWGRDTMIALPGLTLYTGKFDVAREILETFAASVNQGMLPNRFPDDGEQPEYNTVDATLWFFEAVRAYTERSCDREFAWKMYPTLLSIIDWHIKGTRYGIRMHESGLLEAGIEGVQLTWMDAKIGDWVVTPRKGKPVEIQALWYNALMITSGLAAEVNDRATKLRLDHLASMLKWSFNRTFWNEKAGCLYDVVNGGPPDPTIRPNQIFAVSLRYSMLAESQARSVVNIVREHLLTPFGLRTLSPSDPRYRGRYAGGPYERDSVYHQGTVWPWLLGPFVSAYVKVKGGSEAARQEAARFFDAFPKHLREAGVGQISEILDGDFPHNPKGCFAQAWSVGELLRALCEDVYQVARPPETELRSKQTVGA